jgi:hypothetical protein
LCGIKISRLRLKILKIAVLFLEGIFANSSKITKKTGEGRKCRKVQDTRPDLNEEY